MSGSEPVPTRVAITGATGLIGGRLTERLREKDIEVVALVRNPDKARRTVPEGVILARWDFHAPDEGDWREHLATADAVVHLAGTPLFEKRWTRAFKAEIESSRIESTRQLVEAIAQQARKPRVFVSASAVGFYGTDPAPAVTEESAPADDLLARICVRWEDEARRITEHGVRAAQIRIGIVLSRQGGALRKMLPPFRLGLGGVLGRPDCFVNWIHLDDVARLIAGVIEDETLSGPVNAVAPGPVTNATFARTLSRALRRPCLLRVPVPLLRIPLGEAANYISGGPRASCERIRSAGFRFGFGDLGPALEHLLRP